MNKRYLVFAIVLFAFGVYYIKKDTLDPFIGWIVIAFSLNYLFMFFSNRIQNRTLRITLKVLTFLIPTLLLLYYFFIYKDLSLSCIFSGILPQ